MVTFEFLRFQNFRFLNDVRTDTHHFLFEAVLDHLVLSLVDFELLFFRNTVALDLLGFGG